MWLMRVGDTQQVAELARFGQARLAGLAGLDMVSREWLHMTTLIAGFADEISSGQVEAMADQVRRLLAGTPPITVILGRVLYHPRAVMLAAQPPSALEPVLHAVQEEHASLRDATVSCITSHGLRTSRSHTPTPHARQAR